MTAEPDSDMLSLDQLRQLRREEPERLFGHLREVERSFLFGIEDHREDVEGWGGEVRVVLNRNLDVHFVRRLNEAMTAVEELPRFCVLPDAERADSVEETSTPIDDEESVPGAVFYVDPQDYDVMLGDALRVAERYEDLDVVPDTYFLDTELVSFLNRVVLEHPTVRAEREFDFRRGLVGGSGPPPLEDEEPVPAIPDEPEPDADADEDDDDRDDGITDGEHLRTMRL